jgi:transposase
MAQPPSRPEARSRFGPQSASELWFLNRGVGIEASGGYERGVTRALLAAGMPVRQVNPFKLRQFARASGILAKNDPLDARMIASFVAVMPTRPA